MRPLRLAFVFLICAAPAAAQRRPLSFEDLMRFRTIEGAVLSDDGRTAALTAQPDRGDPEGLVYRTDARAANGRAAEPVRVPRGSNAAVSSDGRWAAFRLNAPLEAAERARRAKREPAPGGLVLVDVASGRQTAFEGVKAFAFARGGRHLVFQYGKPDTLRADTLARDTTGMGEPPRPDSLQRVPRSDRKGTPGSRLVVRELASGRDLAIPYVRDFALSPDGRHLAYAVAHRDSLRDGLYARDLSASGLPETALDVRPHGAYAHLAWSKAEDGRTSTLAFLQAVEGADGKPGDAALWTYAPGAPAALRLAATAAPDGWRIPPGNRLTWTDDGQQLFFGMRPREAAKAPRDTALTVFAPKNILLDRTVDVWNARDARINPQQKKLWSSLQERVWLNVLHADGRIVRLDSADVLLAEIPQNGRTALALGQERYAREASWDDTYGDVFAVDLATGRKALVTTHLDGPARLSPDGRAVVYFRDGAWHAFDVAASTTRPLTAGLSASFAREDHDLPGAAGPYGLGGWLDEGRTLLAYDRFDVWALPLDGGGAVNHTAGEGRRARKAFRVEQTDPEKRWTATGEPLLLSSFDDATKASGFYRLTAGRAGAPVKLAEEPKRFAFRLRAKGAPVVLYTREAYGEFPDLWVTDDAFRAPRRLTDINPQRADFAWGTSELFTWRDADGLPVNGVLLKPEDYDPAKRYPVIVYFYELLSQTLHAFGQPQVSHRLTYPQYTGDGYVLFLPDIRYEVGRPGLSAVKSIVPGVQALIDRGIADPARVGIHGHSWGAYQAAYVITQTNIFRAASAGAPVSNMTSAYGGIRWETGLGRQFQYERTQSRIGASLWAARDRYVENSPLFYADRVRTPLLLIHGDEDGAVPWEQSIEFYLALRRLGKETVFLQYRGEGHHPRAYANRLDWSMRLKAWFDAHLKGAPAPAWMTDGVPYAGE